MGRLRRNGRYRQLAGYGVALVAFLACWLCLTIIIVFIEETLFGAVDLPQNQLVNRGKNNWQRGVQVIMGHYNGNLPAERLANLTHDELNANNYNPIDGYGQGGRAVLLNDKDDLESEKTFGINQFNLWISDRIALNRSLPDVRRAECRAIIYPPPSALPTTSVIIVYHNEAFSTLARTIYSVISRSPPALLHEIILVDDYSSRTFLGAALEEFVAALPVPVKIVRAQQRVGLIRARLMGASEATADVLTFLDSHCECTRGWLTPLLARIHADRRAVVCPVIDVINDRTFAYQKGIELFRGGFNWNLQFRWYAVPSPMAKQRASNPTAPIPSPTMAGGLFSIDRLYFEELGTYDDGMDIWGGENIEISFRIWQCGGRVEILPCSHVGHIFRKSSPHDFPKGRNSGKVLNGNLVRVSEVWMDNWKHLFYKIAPQAAALSKSVDVSERVELRKKLECRDFAWYLRNVWPEHFMPTTDAKFGRLIHLKQHSVSGAAPCVRWVGSASGVGHMPTIYTGCATAENSTASERLDRTQMWIFTKSGRLRSDENQCLSATQVVKSSNQWILQLKECGEFENEVWSYSDYYQTFTHQKSELCLDEPLDTDSSTDAMADSVTRIPTVRRCRRGRSSQRWKIRVVDWLPDDDRVSV